MPVKIKIRLKELSILLISGLFLSLNTTAFALQTVLTNGDSLELFGIGLHQEKRNDIYLGAVFAAPDIKQVKQLLNINTSKRMSFKFVSKFSNRKMARMLKQRIAMNNLKTKWRPHTAEIIQFANLFQRSMQAGDEINIDYIANEETQVFLNGTLFLTIKKPDFYALLLNIWFGAIPPSESFKTGIQGNNAATINNELLAKYDSLQTQAGRFDADKNLTDTDKASSAKVASAPKKTKKPASSSKKVKSTKKKRKKTTSTKKPTSKVDPSTKEKVATKATKKPTNKATSEAVDSIIKPSEIKVVTSGIKLDSLLTAPILEAPAVTDTSKEVEPSESEPKEVQNGSKLVEVADEPSLEDINPASEQAEESIPFSIEDLATQAPATEPDSDKIAKLNLPVEEIDLDLISGSYSQELFEIIHSKQIYPVRALRKGIEGELNIQITVNQDGQIIDLTIIKASGSRVLDRGVLKMLRRAGPFPKIPEELDLQKLEIEIPLAFKLAD